MPGAAQWRIQVNKPIVAQLEDNQVSQCFLAGSSDQMLHFDCKNPQDLSAFLQFASQQEDFYVYEAFSTDCATVIDENENSYQAQIQLMFYHKDRLYEPYIPSSTPPAKEESKVILQGNDWLYFEVYIHPSRADSILCDQVSTFLNAYAEAFKCFFFIRYNHPTSHLRLRFQLKQPKYGYFYIEQFTELFRPAIISGLVSDIQIKPYIRELDRYGEERITETEHHFEQSSKLVLDIIANGYSTSDKYNSCISLARSMLDSLDLNLREQQHMVKEIQDAFIREHNFSNAELKLINKEFADAARQGNRTIVDHADLRSIKESFFKMIKRSETSISRKLFRDLFHMHVNRMFSANQRLHELVIYSVLYKDLLRNGYSSKV
ncbi:MAG: hypothetical protein EOO20_18330 [Chryseobacterium sp.]|nr:MAG: hypothetical protein EOO20_18330 [Chryseobacterium sp.]